MAGLRPTAVTRQPLRRPEPGGEVPDPCLVVIDGPRLGQCLHVHPVPAILGRDASADFRLADPSVSRAHCSVRRDGDHIILRDLHSKNGTFVNGQRVQTTTLHEGDRLQLGDVVLKFASGRLEERYQEGLFGLAMLDALTRLPNRRHFRQVFDEAVAAFDPAEPLWVAIVDVDCFRQLNQLLGHDSGDAVLRAIGASIQAQLRPGDAAGRLGGDEFAVMLRGLDTAAVLNWTDRLRLRVAADHEATTLSIGLAAATPGQGASDLLHAADLAMLQAKREGRDRVVRAGG